MATRWSSTYFMIEASLKSKTILTTMCSEDEGLRAFKILDEEWIIARKLCNLLQIIYSATATESGSYYVTLSMI